MVTANTARFARRAGALIDAARAALEGHSHFRGRVDRFTFEEIGGTLVISGTVPTFYLKSVVQSLLQNIDGMERVINRVNVVCGTGLSGCSLATREQCALQYAWLGKRPECFPTCRGTPGDPEEL
jgi:hypothetical protein